MRIAVVGASINGAYIARKLAERGEVTLFDRKSDNQKVCSALVSERIWEYMPKDDSMVKHEIEGVNIHYGIRSVRVKFKPKMLVFDRHILNGRMVELAERAGVDIQRDKFVHGVSENALNFGDSTENFDKIIGSDGAMSKMRDSLKLPKPKIRLGIQAFISKSDESNYVDTYPTKNGFFWKIPRGDSVECGILESPEIASQLFKKMASKFGFENAQIEAAPIPEGVIIPNSNDVTLCGDAAGLTKPWSAGGIIWGLNAADMLVNTFPDFLEYRKNAKKFYEQLLFRSRIKSFLGSKFGWVVPSGVKFDGDWGNLSLF